MNFIMCYKMVIFTNPMLIALLFQGIIGIRSLGMKNMSTTINDEVIIHLLENGSEFSTELNEAENYLNITNVNKNNVTTLSYNMSSWLLNNATHPVLIDSVIKQTANQCDKSPEDFPGLFTKKQRQNGAVVVVFLIGSYCFIFLAVICDNYFLPCVQKICEALNLSQDVAAATFMSMATSAPEFFVNIIGTFLTQSDIGIGTVVGSSMFNTLGVAALGGLAAPFPVEIDWWPVTRDCVVYLCAITLLLTVAWDGMIHWYEGLALVIAYFIYFVIMFNNKTILRHIKEPLEKRFRSMRQSKDEITKHGKNDCFCIECSKPQPIKNIYVVSNHSTIHNGVLCANKNEILSPESEIKKIEQTCDEKVKNYKIIFALPKDKWYKKMYFIFTWPINVVLYLTIPNPNSHPRLYPIAFILCTMWIGFNSYMVSWMMKEIGYTFGIPDSVLGLTFLAAGGCMPEAIAIMIMLRKGEGAMGVSNSMGANTMNILLSLGMPWFVKTMMLGPENDFYIKIESNSIAYIIAGLIFVAVILYITLLVSKFRLSRFIGAILLLIYTVIITIAIVFEMVFFQSERC